MQVGLYDNYEYFYLDISQPSISFFNIFPDMYKVVGLQFYRNFDIEMTERSTYGLLEFLGDLGGLDQTLYIIGSLLLGSLSQFTASSYVVA